MTVASASLLNVHALVDGNPITGRKRDDIPDSGRVSRS